MKRSRNIFAIVPMVILATLAFANTQGPNSAATITGTGWTSPANAATTNAVYATESVVSLGCSDVLVFSVYGFSVPSGAIINGVTVSIVGHGSASGLDLSSSQGCGAGTQLTKTAGVGVGSVINDATPWSTIDATFTEGSGATLWGTTWTSADINGTGFGVLVRIENTNGTLARTANVDSVLVTVTFTPTCGSCFLLLNAGRQTQTRASFKNPEPADHTQMGKGMNAWHPGVSHERLRLKFDGVFHVVDFDRFEAAEHVLPDQAVASDSSALAESIDISCKDREFFCDDFSDAEICLYCKGLSAETITARDAGVFHFWQRVFAQSGDLVGNEGAACARVDDEGDRFSIHFSVNENKPLSGTEGNGLCL